MLRANSVTPTWKAQGNVRLCRSKADIEQLMSLARIDQEKAELIQQAAGAVASPDPGSAIAADGGLEETAEPEPTGESEDNQSTEEE